MKHIGFTGTRSGMTSFQRRKASQVVCDIIGGDRELLVVAHHGDCVGADKEFHDIVRGYGCAVCIHPPIDKTYAAGIKAATHVDGAKTERREPKTYMARNADIVAESDLMIATPAESTEQKRGGTWATIRMARKAGKPLAIVLPGGTVQYERWPE
jgi:hypothetical protein